MQLESGFPERGKLGVPSQGSLHLWFVSTVDSNLSSAGTETLSPVESERWDRLRNPAARVLFLAARIALRRLVSAYLDIAAEDVPIEIGVEGKPILRGVHASALSFNLSHSGEWVLLGFAGGASIGVDLEVVRPFPNILEVAGRVLTIEEVDALRRLAPDDRERAFFRGWTRKEAIQKARGVGIWDHPSHFASGLGGSLSDQAVSVVPDPGGQRVWTVLGVNAPAGYAAAAAIEGENLRIEIARHKVSA
jgi:4'-phosphopantetheinyl transferase